MLKKHDSICIYYFKSLFEYLNNSFICKILYNFLLVYIIVNKSFLTQNICNVKALTAHLAKLLNCFQPIDLTQRFDLEIILK